MCCWRHTLCVPDAARVKVLVDTMPRLKDDTQRWDMLLAKGGEHKGLMGVVFGGSSSDCVNGRGTHMTIE